MSPLAIAQARATRQTSLAARQRSQALRHAVEAEYRRSHELQERLDLRNLWTAPSGDLRSVLVRVS